MATTTTNLGLTKPALSESADVGVINDNSDKIDVEAGKARANLAAEYNASSSYSVGDYCTRGGNLYRCTTAIGSGGEAWNSNHWTQVAVTGEIPKVINNLTSTSTSAALSAKQGKELNDTLTENGIGKDAKGAVSLTNLAFTLTIPAASMNIIFLAGDGGSRLAVGILFKASSGSSASFTTIYKGDNVTVTTSTNSVTFTFNSSTPVAVRILNVKGDGITLP